MGFFMLDAYVVSWPACAKNLELTLVLATFIGPSLNYILRKYKHDPKTVVKFVKYFSNYFQTFSYKEYFVIVF